MRYGRMFQYLFRMKRMQVELERAWVAMGSQRGSSLAASWDGSAGLAPLWQVRSHMAHFINNLQLYIQVQAVAAICQVLRLLMAAICCLQ